MGHARALVNIADPKKQVQILDKVIEEGLSVRAVEELVRKTAKEGKEEAGVSAVQAPGSDYTSEVEKLNDFFHTNVEIKDSRNGKGKIVISYNSKEDLDRILSLLD